MTRHHFAGCFGEDQIKARYRSLCREYHPDLNRTRSSANLSALMSIDQALSERQARKIPHWKRRKVIAPQTEFSFAADSFRLVGELLPEPAPERMAPERAAELFDLLHKSL